MKNFLLIIMVVTIVFGLPDSSYANISNKDILDSVLDKYQSATATWAATIQVYAEHFFSGLAVIGFVWQLSQAWFHRSSFAEVFGEILRYMAFCGIFLWFLRNGPELALAIIRSLMKIGSQASGQSELNPSDIVDMGFSIYDTAQKNLDIWSGTSIAAYVISLVVLIIFALVGVNMLLQLCSAWILAYAGIIFLGFGGSYWTKDMAINYFKTVLGVGASLMTMTLLIGIGTNIVTDAIAQMDTSGAQNLTEMAALLVTSITLFMLVDKLPALVAGIINGASIGSAGIGSFGAGAAVGAAAASMGLAATSISKSASIIAGAAKGGAALVAGGAGLASAYNAAKESLISNNIDNFNKSNAAGGISSESLGFVKPPSATAVVEKMAGAAASSAFTKATENSFGGNLAKTISGKGTKATPDSDKS